MFLILKKKWIYIFFAILFVIICLIVYFTAIKPTVIPKAQYTVVVDAGHGGIDKGCEGVSGTKESVLNLEYAKVLSEYLKNLGMKVVMTRNDEYGLYSQFASNKKKDDMKKRKEIIEYVKADIVISVHMNSYPSSSSRGAQVFYNPENSNSKLLADNIQHQFVLNLTEARKNSEKGDYYIINCTNVPSVIVECGFISNKEEESLLLQKSYCDKVCYSIACGVLSYLL